MQKLRNADEAGDTYAASRFANMIRDQDASGYSVSGKAPKDLSYIEQFAGGAKHAWDRAAAGLEGILKAPIESITGTPLGRDVTPTQLEQGRQFIKQTGPASTVGEVAGDVAITAPSIARAAGLALPLTRKALATAATGGATGLVTTPGGSLMPAATGAAGAAIPGVAGSVLPKAVSAAARRQRSLATGIPGGVGVYEAINACTSIQH